MPSPCSFVEKNDSKRCRSTSGASPGPVSRTADLDFAFAPGRAHGDGGIDSGRRRGVERVEREVEHDLLQLDRIASDRRQLRLQRQLESRATKQCVTLEQMHGLPADLVQVNACC